MSLIIHCSLLFIQDNDTLILTASKKTYLKRYKV